MKKLLVLFMLGFSILTGCTTGNRDTAEKNLSGVNMLEALSVKPKNVPAAKETKKAESDKPLEGFKICIDAGHGKTSKRSGVKEPVAPGAKIMKAAYASGTSGVYTKISEASLNLTVSKKLQKVLTDLGAEILMVREKSECDLSNVERAKLWNSSNVDLTLRIHANGSDNSKVSGVLMMVPGNKYIRDKEMLKKSEKAGQYILDGVIKNTGAKSQGMTKSSDLTGFNWSEVPVVLLEMGFMTNPAEDKLLNTNSYQDKIVLGIAEGIKSYNEATDAL